MRSTFLPLRHLRPLAVGETVTLGPELAEGLAARQVNPKEAFTLSDAEGRFFRASLLELDARSARALVYEPMVASPESPIALTVMVAVLARQRMIFVAQKTAELGAARLVPVFTEHSVGPGKALEKEKPWAWQGQGLKGSRQCRRASVMEVASPISFQAALASRDWRDAEGRFALDDAGAAPCDAIARVPRGATRVALFVGPEGGFSAAEREALGAHAVRFGGRVVRAETAVLMGVTLLQHRLGDLG
ncbi:MAG: 16S rRNA (uracil(1498)-N(3))-methyltransferase [Myxococcales bacterium]|nr:16S rRNA (uracil(1498)-N(3))-methyltransferase [Myxococcales bacterium]